MGKNKKSPSKIIISVGEELTQSTFSGDISGANLINAIIHLTKDAETATGLNSRVVLSYVAEVFGLQVVKKTPNPTMRASTSKATADTEERKV